MRDHGILTTITFPQQSIETTFAITSLGFEAGVALFVFLFFCAKDKLQMKRSENNRTSLLFFMILGFTMKQRYS